MIEAPLDRGKWRKEMKKRWRRGAGLRGELTRKIWHLARLPHRFLPLASVRFPCTQRTYHFFRPARLGIDSPWNGLTLASSAFTIENRSSGVFRAV